MAPSTLPLLSLAALTTAATNETSQRGWAALRTQLDAWPFTDAFAVAVGDERGNVFTYERGGLTLTSPVGTASTSKWPIAMGWLGIVADNSVKSLDEPVSNYIQWWTTDKRDPRSRVTLRHLLSFTSGFGDGAPGVAAAEGSTCMDAPSAHITYDECAKELYETSKQTGEPGTVYSYNSIHLQLAGAVALHATGLTDIQTALSRYLFEPYGMANTTCATPSETVPQVAVCLETTGADYERFLARTLSHSVLPAALVRESEKDATPFLANDYTLYGDYAFGHFLECFDSVEGFTDACKTAKIHADPGAYGFYPLIDRQKGYYLEIVAYEASRKTYPRSGIPEYLRLLVKPLVDAAIAGDRGDAFSHHEPAQAGLTLADINYVAGCYLHPSGCV